jgi:uncharacterized protein (DUF1800 family)
MPTTENPAISTEEIKASRFLAQATMGVKNRDIVSLCSRRGKDFDEGLKDWALNQLKTPSPPSLFNTLLAGGYHNKGNFGGPHIIDEPLWNLFIEHGGLRMRVAFALSQIFVINGNTGKPANHFAVAAFMDMLIDNAFGNYRTLLEKICLSPAMANDLTYLNNRKANPETGSLPDENFARELLQLFSIGLYNLNLDGTLKLKAGKPEETYDQEDIMGLARVFTGWGLNLSSGRIKLGNVIPSREPLIQSDRVHEPGEKIFLGKTISAGTDGYKSLSQALDHIFHHPNVPPFICKQLIQRLVTSNPSKEYVRRVAEKFRNNGQGVRGDLAAVIMAILFDTEARSIPSGTSTIFRTSGKLREPVLRFSQWARAFDAKWSRAFDARYRRGHWTRPNLDDPVSRLGQSPLRSPSVFNFFRPGYVPPGTELAADGKVAPEFQITDAISVAGYINFMQIVINNNYPGIKANYQEWLPLASNPAKLVDRLSLVLAANQIGGNIKLKIVNAISTIKAPNDAGKEKRLQAAILIIMSCPQFVAIV